MNFYSPSNSHWSQNPNSRDPMCYNGYQYQDHPGMYDRPSDTEYPQSHDDHALHHEQHSRADPYVHHDHTTPMEGVYYNTTPFSTSCEGQAQMSYPQQWYASDSYSLGDRAPDYYPSHVYRGEFEEVHSHAIPPSSHEQTPVSSHNSSPYHYSGQTPVSSHNSSPYHHLGSSSHCHSPASYAVVQETGRKKSWGTPPSRNAHLARLEYRVQSTISTQPASEENSWKAWNWGCQNVGLRPTAAEMGPSPLDTSESFRAGGHDYHRSQW